MTKVVYNGYYGGFSISEEAIDLYWELKGETQPTGWWPDSIERDDPYLVQVVEELGEKANGRFADLQIRDVPAGSLYIIDEYDGFESVVLQDEYKWKIA